MDYRIIETQATLVMFPDQMRLSCLYCEQGDHTILNQIANNKSRAWYFHFPLVHIHEWECGCCFCRGSKNMNTFVCGHISAEFAFEARLSRGILRLVVLGKPFLRRKRA